MTVNATSRTAASNPTAAASSTSSTSKGSSLGTAAGLGKNDFMKLLMAQLQNQDPMKPMEDKEFITQLAQFSSLEAIEQMTAQMEELTGSQLLVQAATMIGKTVSAKLESGEVITGTISQVRMLDGKPVAVVNGREIPTSLITQIS